MTFDEWFDRSSIAFEHKWLAKLAWEAALGVAQSREPQQPPLTEERVRQIVREEVSYPGPRYLDPNQFQPPPFAIGPRIFSGQGHGTLYSCGCSEYTIDGGPPRRSLCEAHRRSYSFPGDPQGDRA